jgi:acyl-CoA dehydrogenase
VSGNRQTTSYRRHHLIGGNLLAAARQIGEDVAARWAADVDAEARFPGETVAELRRSGLLGALVPPEWGGPGLSLEETSAMVVAIAEHCASSGLILAMHHIQVASLVRHATEPALDRLLPSVVAGDLLLANANSEIGLGGERRTSLCALETTGEGFRIEKQASTVSYGEYADGILATARRTPDSQGNDQVMVVCLPPSLRLEPTGDWDTIGLRGTCSRPALLVADVPADLVISDYADVFMRTSLPASAVLLSSVWLGLGESAGRRAHTSVRSQARSNRESSTTTASPTAALRLAELGVFLHQLREVVAGGAIRYDLDKDTPEVETLRFSSRMDNLKLSSSTLVLEIVQRAMAICGLTGYKNQSSVSMSRIMRDAAAAPLMVNNDRALQAMAQTLLVRKEL